MRWRMSNCIILTCIVASLATDDTNNAARPKRDIAFLKKLFKSILVGSHHVLNKIAPTPEPTPNSRGNIKVYHVPGYHNTYITEECDGKQRKLYFHPNIDVLESYLGTTSQEETSKALEGVKNLFESEVHHKHKSINIINSHPYHPFYINYPSEEEHHHSHFIFSGHKPQKVEIPAKYPVYTGGVKEDEIFGVENSTKLEIITHPVQQALQVVAEDNILFKPADLHRPIDSHPLHSFYMYPEAVFGSPKKNDFVLKEPEKLPLHIGGIKEKEKAVVEHEAQNQNKVTESPIPKPPTFDDLGSSVGVDVIEEILPAVSPEEPVLISQPVVFDHEPIEIIPAAPIITTPHVIHPMPPTHLHPIIEPGLEDFHLNPVHSHQMPSKYSYNQINQDGSLTKILNHGPDVFVTNQPRPLPSYIFDRFKWICSKYGVNIAHTRPVTHDIPVTINPIIVHSHDDRPLFNTQLNPIHQVSFNPDIHHQHPDYFPYHNLHGNFRTDEVHVKSTNKKPETFSSNHELPVNPISASTTVFQNSNIVKGSPIPKPPTLDGFPHIDSNVGVEVIEEIPPEGLIFAQRPFAFDLKPLEVIPEAPTISTPQIIHEMPPTHLHTIIDTNDEKYESRPRFQVQHTPSKFTYNQINQDGSLTNIHNHDNSADVFVTNQPRPLPSYIFNRFQWICSKFGVNVAQTRPLSNDIPVIINPVMVHSHNDKPIFYSSLKPTHQVPLNSGWHHQYSDHSPYYNFRPDEVNVKITNRKPESFNKLPINPIYPGIKSIPEPPFLINRIENVAASVHSVKTPEHHNQGHFFRIMQGKADFNYTGAENLAHSDTDSIAGRIQQVTVSDPNNHSPKVSSGYSFNLVNGKENIGHSDVSSKMSSREEEEDVKLDVRKEFVIRSQVNSAIENSLDTGITNPNYTTERINQAAATADSVEMPKHSTGYSLSLANGKGTVTYGNLSDTVNFETQENFSNLVSTKEESHKSQHNILSSAINDIFGKKASYEVVSIDTNTNPTISQNSDKVNDILFIPSAKAQEETPSPIPVSTYNDNIPHRFFVPQAGIENKALFPAVEIKSNNYEVSTPYVNAERVIFKKPVSSRYMYKQLSDSKPNFTVVKVEDPPHGSNIKSNVYVSTSPVSERNDKTLPSAFVEVEPDTRFSYKVTSNENDRVKPLKDYFLSNPIVVPDEEVSYSYNQNKADGSSLTVHGNRNQKVSVSRKRGDIPDY